MEIRYLEQGERERSRALYEEVFVEDEEAFVDAYYRVKAADNEILTAVKDGEIVSMLHRNPYTFRFRGSLVRADYLVAVATRGSFRHQGLMRALLTQALRDMERERQPFTFLMPADEAIYLPFDFRLMGNVDEEGLKYVDAAQLAEGYDLYVEKDEDYIRRHVDWPGWEATPMMIRLLHLPSFAERIGASEPLELVIAVEDPILAGNNQTFLWKFRFGEDGQEGSSLLPTDKEAKLHVSIADLGSFLCGMMGAEELPGLSAANKPEEVLEKLRKIRVLDGIYINETV